jgi:hypothetical protein
VHGGVDVRWPLTSVSLRVLRGKSKMLDVARGPDGPADFQTRPRQDGVPRCCFSSPPCSPCLCGPFSPREHRGHGDQDRSSIVNLPAVASVRWPIQAALFVSSRGTPDVSAGRASSICFAAPAESETVPSSTRRGNAVSGCVLPAGGHRSSRCQNRRRANARVFVASSRVARRHSS